ncbi:MAG: NAD(P)/FAD-dependent oxidoreductase [Acidobacteriota bacterium]|nr:NAD(P)/FAD-dependent oxidoreductase [Acidobacteriota bacterium]MDH3524808.1 NAD(P)/FAD-dependent oxidoreductase [Acidobacteriota bacterium]
MSTPEEADVLVVGGGPAGLATAVACRRRGLEVLVADRSAPPIDKPCGEGLMPDGVRALAELGVTLPPDAGRPFRGIRYVGDGVSVRADFPEVRGLAVRRPRLHAALVDRARELGVRFAWRTPVRGLTARGVATDGGELTGRWLVGADGLHSRVRRWSGLDAASRRPARFGVRRHYRMPPWSDDVEVHWADRCEAYVWGAAADEVGVAMLWSGEKAGFDALLARFPGLEARLAGTPRISRDRGAGPFDQRVRSPCAGRVALVGDAAGYRDAITGEGLALAFHQALALARCLAGGDLRPYPRAVRRLTRRPYLFIRLLLAAEARPAARRRMLRALAASPELFARLLAIHGGERPLSTLGWSGAWRLARGLAAPPPR